MSVALLVAAWFAQPALAQTSVPVAEQGKRVEGERKGGPWGFGVGTGAPSGFTTKLWFGSWSGLQASVGGDLGRLGDVVATGDYVVHFRPFYTEADQYSVPLHIGAGFNFSTNVTELQGAVHMGPRLVFGASVLVKELPVELFVDSAPTFYFYEDLTWSFDGQIGLRYYP